MIHCIGDSHCCIFSGKLLFHTWNDSDRIDDDILPEFRTYRIGPTTAYHFDSKLETVKNIIDQFVKEGDTVMPCCGEVDCRAHLLKQVELQKLPIEIIVQQCVSKYFEAIVSLKQYLDAKRINLAVWGPIASFADHIKYPGPFQGTCRDRNAVTQLFTIHLKGLCDQNNIPFGSIFNKMISSGLRTYPNLLAKHIHSSLKTIPLIYRECKRIGLINK